MAAPTSEQAAAAMAMATTELEYRVELLNRYVTCLSVCHLSWLDKLCALRNWMNCAGPRLQRVSDRRPWLPKLDSPVKVVNIQSFLLKSGQV